MSSVIRIFLLVVFTAADVPAAEIAGAWLPKLPAEFSLDYLPGITRVNGVELRLAVARTSLSRSAAQRAIIESWDGAGDPIGTEVVAESLVVSRRVGRWNDTASIVADEQGVTRVTFSRLDLRKRVGRVRCALHLPHDFILRSITQSEIRDSDVKQCMFWSPVSGRTAKRVLESELRRQGWRDAGGGAWRRRADVLHASVVDGSRGALVVISSEPNDVP